MKEAPSTTDRTKIVVLGGGFAGLESAFLIRQKLGDRAAITIVSDRDHFLFKPNTIYIPFGASEESLLISLERAAGKRGIRFVRARSSRSIRRRASCGPADRSWRTTTSSSRQAPG